MQRQEHAEKNLFMNRAGWAQVHRHLLDLFPLTWGRHLAIQSPPSLYQQEGALRRCCSSEPVQLDTKYCRESLSFTPAGRGKKKKKKEYYSSSGRTPALPLQSPTFPLAGQVDENVSVCVCAGAGEWHILQEQTQDTAPRHTAQLDSLLERWLKHWNVRWIIDMH